MSNIQHKTLGFTSLHETKGIAGAGNGTIGFANGSGSEAYGRNFSAGLQIGGGTLVTNIVIYTVTFSVDAPAANLFEQDVAVMGVTTSDTLLVTHPKFSG